MSLMEKYNKKNIQNTGQNISILEGYRQFTVGLSALMVQTACY